jgi:hypothetical protein
MQVTIINPAVIGGQGGIGSSTLGMANPAPGVGPMGGDAGTYDIAVSFSNPGDGIMAEANEPLPAHIDSGGPMAIAAPAPSMTEKVMGGPHTFNSQYDTIKPIPQG